MLLMLKEEIAVTCRHCGTVHDRDLNAAKNILAAGRAERLNACGAGVRPGLVPAAGGEAGTHRGAASSGAAGIPVLQAGEDVKEIESTLERDNREFVAAREAIDLLAGLPALGPLSARENEMVVQRALRVLRAGFDPNPQWVRGVMEDAL